MPRCGKRVKSGRYGDAVRLRNRRTDTGSRAGVYAVVVALCLISVSCTSGETADPTSTTSPARTDEPPFEPVGFNAAGRGNDLVVIDALSDQMAIRFADGTWSALPSIPDNGVWRYVTVGPTVVAGGYSCAGQNPDGECSGDVSAFRLAEDLSAWERLDTPKESVDPETEMTVTTGPQEVGVFNIGQLSLAIDSDGTVTTLDAPSVPTPNGAVSCVVDDTRVIAAYGPEADLTLPVPVVDAVAMQPLAAPDSDWTPVEPVPAGIQNWIGRRICGPGYMSILPQAGTAEWVVDLATATLSQIESNTLEMVADPGYMDPGEQAIAADIDTVYVTNTNGRTVRRTGLGPWEDTGVNVTAIYATGSAVWGFDPTAGDFIQLP